MKSYAVVRHFFNGERETIKTGLSEEDAMDHCLDPETSSSTCTTPEAIAICKEHGPWFDGYTEE